MLKALKAAWGMSKENKRGVLQERTAGCWLSAVPRSCWLLCSAALVTHQSSLFLWDVLLPRSLLTTLAGFSFPDLCKLS